VTDLDLAVPLAAPNPATTDWVPLGGGGTFELAYAEFTSAVSLTATSETTAQTAVTAPPITVDGATVILVECFVAFVRPDGGAANRSVALWLYQDGASIGELAQVLVPVAGLMDVPVRAARRLTPSAGSHTYSLRGHTSAGTGTLFAGPGGLGQQSPGYIRITRV
jgi:hypothetical protein